MSKKKPAKPVKAKAKPVKKPVTKRSPVSKRNKKVIAAARGFDELGKVEKTVRGEHEQAARFQGVNIIEGEAEIVLTPEESQQEEERRKAHELRVQQEKFAQEWLDARLKKMKLVEVPVKGTIYSLVSLPDRSKAPPTMEQRTEMAHRLNSVGPLLPKYIARYVDPALPGRSVGAVLDHAVEYEGGDEMEKRKLPMSLEEKMKVIGDGAIAVAKKHEKLKAEQAKEKPVKASKLVKADKKAAAPAPAVAPKKKAALTPAKVPAGGFNKTNKPATSGELIRSLIMEHKLDDEQIATLTRKLFEGRNTKVSDVRWNRGQMRNAGISAPDPVGGEPQKGKGKK